MDNLKFLSPVERLVLKIRNLFWENGFNKVSVAPFDDYHFLVEHKNLFQMRDLIAFTDSTGKMLAMRPDITLSISKQSYDSGTHKLYYVEDVFRFDKQTKEHVKEEQIGVELLSAAQNKGDEEILTLAINALKMIDNDYAIVISHLGYVSALINSMQLSNEEKEKVIFFLHTKNAHDLKRFLVDINLSDREKTALVSIIGVNGKVETAIRQARQIATNDDMIAAIDDIEELTTSLKKIFGSDIVDSITLDFSLINDLDYYNDIVFAGYIQRENKPILVGGRYDGLMKKLGKDLAGTGFAISLDSLNELNRKKAKEV